MPLPLPAHFELTRTIDYIYRITGDSLSDIQQSIHAALCGGILTANAAYHFHNGAWQEKKNMIFPAEIWKNFNAREFSNRIGRGFWPVDPNDRFGMSDYYSSPTLPRASLDEWLEGSTGKAEKKRDGVPSMDDLREIARQVYGASPKDDKPNVTEAEKMMRKIVRDKFSGPAKHKSNAENPYRAILRENEFATQRKPAGKAIKAQS